MTVIAPDGYACGETIQASRLRDYKNGPPVQVKTRDADYPQAPTSSHYLPHVTQGFAMASLAPEGRVIPCDSEDDLKVLTS